MRETAVSHNAPFITTQPTNTGIWQYPADSFIHPIALQIWDGVAYMIDGGRVLALDVQNPSLPRVLLAPGDEVADVGTPVTVIEPLDLVADADGLLVLDRAGDVYRYEWATETWLVEWYMRPIGDTSSHYYVALGRDGDARYLLETSYKFMVQYADGAQTALWPLPERRGVDVAVQAGDVFVLMNEMDSTAGTLTLYRETALIDSFAPTVAINQPRDLAMGQGSVRVLDENGRRLLKLGTGDGIVQEIIQLPNSISTIATDPQSDALLLAGRDRLYFYDNPTQTAHIAADAVGDGMLAAEQPHDVDWLAQIDGFASPIGPNVSNRDLQMPGAPRHYRLGVHQGSDFYWARGTQVVAVADGTVIRAVLDYVPPFPAAYYNWRVQSHELGYTSDEALDFYRGRQVWVQHDNGLISRYVHLSAIDYRIAVGERVLQGQPIGLVGNSGSPAALESDTEDAHLHFELWRGDYYIGQFLRPIETREWIETILNVE